MLPNFEVKQYGNRFFVETDWYTTTEINGFSVRTQLQVTTSGRLSDDSAGWSTQARARAAMEQCKARLR